MGANQQGKRVTMIRKNQRKMIKLLTIVFVVFLSMFPSHIVAKEDTTIKDNQIVRVGYFLVDGFQEYNKKTKTFSGYGYEFLMAIASYTDWQYEFVLCDTFTDAYNKLEKGEIDLLNDVSKVEGRNIEYTQLNAGEGCSYLLMRNGDNRVASNDWEGMSKITIGLDKQNPHSNRMIEILGEHNVVPNVIWYENEQMVIESWKNKEVDAFVAMSDTAIDGHAILSFEPRMYYLASTKGNTKLIAEADFAIQALRANAPDFEATIYDKYYNMLGRNYSLLTKDERKYIEENPTVRVLYIPDWYPISYQDDNGKFAGPFQKIYKLLEKRTGIHFEFVPMDYERKFEGIVETYDCYMLAEHPADYTGAATYDVKLTQTFVNAALVEVSEGTLKKGDTLALVKGDCLSEVAQRILGNDFEYVEFESVEECIKKVKNGTVDGTVLMSYESEYYQSKREYKNLIYTVVNSGSYGFGLAVSNQADPLLYSIIVKGLNSISAGEVNNIFNQMTQDLKNPDLIDTVLDNPVPFAISGILIAIILVYAISSKRFSKKIKEKNNELILANSATTQFFSRMSHDMRTPMNGILGIAELSKNDQDISVLHNEMSKIEQSGKYLLSLINDTLDFQRIETGNLNIEKEVVNFQEVFKNIIDLIEPSAKSKSIDFKIVNHENIPNCYVWADSIRLKQIFMNLLSNAIKFTPSCGTVTVEYICKKQDKKKLYSRFYIKDTGVGMSEEFIKTKLFKPFSQEHNEVSNQYAGSGLGLSIVKNLVDIMNGTINVESEQGTGTNFIVDLDFDIVNEDDIKKNNVKQRTNDIDIEKSLKGAKFLLVEDHPLNAEISMRLLRKIGCEVEWAQNGREGLDKYSRSKNGYYSAILMDVRMPIMNGIEATKQIRKLTNEDAKTIPIIAMTANAYESDVKDCLEAGMNVHISKPINPQNFYQILANQIDQDRK